MSTKKTDQAQGEKRTNGLSLLVPEDRDCEASAIVGFRLEVKFANKLGSVERILISILERPAVLLHVPVDNIDRDDVFKTLQSAHKQRAMSLNRPIHAGDKYNAMVSSYKTRIERRRVILTQGHAYET